MPAADLRARLQRLRLQKLKREVPPPVPAAAPRPRRAAQDALPGVLPGERVESTLGAFQLITTSYDLSYQHGPNRLADMLGHQAATAARLARDEKLAAADLRALAFIDTETTGLAGGAGTLVFLVGVGVCEGEQFVLRQYFLLDPGDEAALLTALVADLAPKVGWVSFNGRAFDLPLLETRLTMNRQRGALGQRPHLDLLMPARRLYRGRLPSCSLGDIERGVFNIARDQDDVPGFMIPGMYLDYLRTGNPDDMRRVIYHNTVDILSMVTLAA
ncbi:MAG: ribonuclease H-like domain-containing protein, partial [Anaerolineales bacterium]